MLLERELAARLDRSASDVAARGRVLCVFNGAMDSSSCSALLFLTIYNALGYSMTWTIYASLSALIIYRTFFLLPADAVPYLWFINII